jgi:hypothetical protein
MYRRVNVPKLIQIYMQGTLGVTFTTERDNLRQNKFTNQNAVFRLVHHNFDSQEEIFIPLVILCDLFLLPT